MTVGEVKSAGSDGNVYIQLFGTKDDSPKIQLRHTGDWNNEFVAGGQYTFTVAEADIGKVSQEVVLWWFSFVWYCYHCL